jgi:hypothetical protein
VMTAMAAKAGDLRRLRSAYRMSWAMLVMDMKTFTWKTFYLVQLRRRLVKRRAAKPVVSWAIFAILPSVLLSSVF